MCKIHGGKMGFEFLSTFSVWGKSWWHMVTSDSFSNGETTVTSCRMLHGSPAASAMAVGGRREWSRSIGRFRWNLWEQIVKAGVLLSWHTAILLNQEENLTLVWSIHLLHLMGFPPVCWVTHSPSKNAFSIFINKYIYIYLFIYTHIIYIYIANYSICVFHCFLGSQDGAFFGCYICLKIGHLAQLYIYMLTGLDPYRPLYIWILHNWLIVAILQSDMTTDVCESCEFPFD